MRVTQSMMNLQMLSNLTINNERMSKLQDQLASGKKINSPSDDPVGVVYALRYHAYINHNEQFKTNANDASSFIDFTDSTLSQINEVLQRARELAVQGANGTLTSDDRNAIKNEVDQLYDQLVQLGNTQFNGKYIFNGSKTDLSPYKPQAWTSNPDNTQIKYLLGDGITLNVNLTGQEVFGDPIPNTDVDPNTGDPTSTSTSDNAFAALKQLSDALGNNDQAGINQALANISSRLDKLQAARADLGARSNRVDLIKNRLDDLENNFQNLLANTEDADMAKTITDLKMAENVQRASLAAGARIIQPTLVDYLK
jgi:flagellar hook-associated protein 3 FlgL